MIIIEQSKTYFVNFNNVCQMTLAVDEDEKEYAIIAKTVDKEELVMGIYSTEEKAKEVLEKIYTFYGLGQKLVKMPEE